MSDVTPIRPEDEFNSAANNDPLESMLDDESDEDFGYVVTRDRATGPDGHPVKLAEWTAQDFASIYTRFRPHLERHARRFLNNPSQVDEVVQDAFLYLMVSLPELDSEIGVLRFLKWKTRLLCLDVIRASGKAYVANLDDVAEPISSDPEVSSYLEQQDDAAVLRLALSKLNPRHREVLLASIYEEKTTEQIAAQVGLSENATRQLVFRARAAFKKALLGDDVDTQGMSAAAILSVAARKAASEAKKVGAQAMVFALFLMLAVGAFVNFTGRGTQTQQLAEAPATQTETPAPVESQTSESVQNSENPTNTDNNTVIAAPVVASAPAPSASPFKNPWAVDDLFESAFADTKLVKASTNKTALVRANYKAVNQTGVTAKFSFLAESLTPFDGISLSFEIEGKTYTAKPLDGAFKITSDASGNDVYTFIGKVGPLVDANGVTWANTALEESAFALSAVLDYKSNALVGSSIGISAKE